MKNRLLDQKRSSLDLSESSSDEEDYRKEIYSKKNRFGESYTSNEQAYSPEPYSLEGSYKPTPKSILKENNISASKGKKNIIINETLNETHRIAQKSESNMTSPEKDQYLDHEDNYKYGGSSLSSKTGDSQSPEKVGSYDDEEDFEQKYNYKYEKEDSKNVVTGFKNRLVIGSSNQGLSDFQRAHVRKLQQEREQELSSKAAKEMSEQDRERWLLEKEKKGLHADDLKSDKEKETNFQYSKEFEENKHNLERIDEDDNEALNQDSNINTLTSKNTDPGSKFEKIESKISHLEKELNAYSKSLTKNVIKQEEKNHNLDKVYGDFEEKLKDLKDELHQSINSKRGAKEEDLRSHDYNQDRSRRSKSGMTYNKSKEANVSTGKRITKSGKSIDKLNGKRKKGPSATFLKLQDEIERLKEQNELLKDRLEDRDSRYKEKSKKRNSEASGPNIDREKELIQTIERIKKKLRLSITQKMKNERDNQIFEIKQEAAAQSFGRNYTSTILSYKDVLMRKTYQEGSSNKENSQSLYKVFPNTYKNYEQPTISEKLRTKK